MKYWLLICTLLFSFCSCSDSELPKDVQKSKITAIARYITSKANSNGSEPKLLFTGDDIAWFNPTSREIKFTTVKSEPFSLPMYAQIDIKLENETLFTIVAHINEFVDRAYDDLVLFHDKNKGVEGNAFKVCLSKIVYSSVHFLIIFIFPVPKMPGTE